MKRSFFCYIISLLISSIVNAQTIVTVAGSGGTTPLGDGSPAMSATLSLPASVTFDNADNFYIADYGNNRIRKVDAAGIISTIAGNGISSSTGDGGSALSASLASPEDILINTTTGDMYIVEYNGYKIRKISSSGIISTIAGTGVSGFTGDGGMATAARIRRPTGIGIDAAGNIYIADQQNCRIRKVSTAGIITTVAGSSSAPGFGGDGGPATAALLNFPSGIAFDASGNMYIADNRNHVVRKIGVSGIITTIAGTPTVIGYAGDGGPATGALLNGPFSVAVDHIGSIFISDGNNVIRKVDALGVISTYAGDGTLGYGGDGGAATIAKLNMPWHIRVDYSGNLYIADNGNNRIRKVLAGVTLSASPGDTVCEGQSVTLNVSVAGLCGTTHSYAWYVNGVVVSTTGSSYTYTPADGDSVRCQVTTSGGVCTAPVTVSSNTIDMVVTPVAVISGGLSVCVGNTTMLSSSGSGGTWSSGMPGIATVSGSGAVMGMSSGTAGITYTEGSCYAAVVVSVAAAGGSLSGAATVCVGAAVLWSAPTPGGAWSAATGGIATVSALGLVSGIAPGTAGITYTLPAGCGDITGIVTVTPAPAAITGTPTVCAGATTTLASATSGGTWGPATGGIATVSAGVVSGVSAGTVIISYTVGGCTTTVTATVVAAPAAITGTAGICEGQTTILSNAASGGSWSSGNAAMATVGSASGIVTGIAAGTAVISYSIGGCYVTTVVTVSTAVPAITGVMALCAGQTTALSNAAAGGVWSSATGGIATVDAASGIVTGVAAGTALITYAPGGGCTATAIVTVHPLPLAGTITGMADVCPGATITLTSSVSGGTWSSSNPVVAAIGSGTGIMQSVAAGTSLISYTVGPDGNGCTAAAVVTVNVITNSFTLTGVVTDVLCYGDSTGTIELTAIPAGSAYSYTWSHGTTGATATGLADGSYSVAVTQTATQCRRTATFSVAMPDSLHVALSVRHSVCRSGGMFMAEVTGGVSAYEYAWVSKDTAYAGAAVEPVPAAGYTLTVTDANNCIYKEEFTVAEEMCNTIFISGGYSPNGDGNNDIWLTIGLEDYPLNTVQVFDKWGDIVYEQTRYQNDWDGTKKSGGRLPDGTYFYLVKLNEPSKTGGDNVFKGTVLIKR